MSRYIIKNCPALIKEAFQNNQIDGVATTAQISKNLCFGNTCIHCADCTDCVLKQIVEKCKERTVGFIEKGAIKDEFLQLLDIQEVE